ncbi:MAG: NAD(P)H-dependent oxidoreductase subunit E [Acidobacteria bacterium]|nr:NAD(P)H-dependent oxidoreductase subunit E [Acidobacteriota bacterium]
MNADKKAAGGQPATLPIDVLVIDEDEAFTETCCRLLEKGGYRTAVAKSGAQGLQSVGSQHPGVVLLDLKLTGMNGVEAISRLVKIAPAAVLIVITGQGTVDLAVESMKLGAFDFLTKPCEPDKLLEAVRRGLNLSMLRREAESSKASAAEQAHPPDKYDLLLQGLDVLGEAYSMGIEKRQLLDELAYLENEAKYHAESLGQIKKKERVILDIREDLLKTDAILKKYDFQKNSLIQVLLDVQEKFRWLPRHILNWISGRLNIPLREIYVVANFYEAFSLEPRGRHIVQVCTGTACHVRGASEMLTRVSAALGIQPGQTDDKLRYTLETVHCIGCCALAPVVQIDNQYYRDPSRSKLEKIIKEFEKEEAQACLA